MSVDENSTMTAREKLERFLNSCDMCGERTADNYVCDDCLAAARIAAPDVNAQRKDALLAELIEEYHLRASVPDPKCHICQIYLGIESESRPSQPVNQELLEALNLAKRELDSVNLILPATRNAVEAAIAHAQAATTLSKVPPDSLSANPVAEGGLKTNAQAATTETFVSRSQEKRVRTMRGDNNPLDPRVAKEKENG